MRVLDYLLSAFSSGPSLPADSGARQRQSEQRSVSRVATGNIRLQRGEYSTREDINREYEQVKSADFRTT